MSRLGCRRLRVTAEFRAAVRSDERGIVRLAALVGFPSYPSFSKLISRPRFAGTPLMRARLQAIAEAIHFTGEVYRG